MQRSIQPQCINYGYSNKHVMKHTRLYIILHMLVYVQQNKHTNKQTYQLYQCSEPYIGTIHHPQPEDLNKLYGECGIGSVR